MSASNSPRSTSERFVAFCDILGFSDQIEKDFDQALDAYDTFVSFIEKLDLKDVDVCIYSDAVLISAEKLDSVIMAVNVLWFSAQAHFFIIRGGIAKGRYWERRAGKNLYMASDALVRAVRIEREVKFPMVAIDDDIEIPWHFWVPRFRDGPARAPLLHFDGRNIVNPFGPFWFASAKGRIAALKAGSPGHEAKYDWLLSLHAAVEAQEILVPEAAVNTMLEMGVIGPTE
jgi:hypothetical protein